MTNDPYADFTTDEEATSNGIMIEYEHFRVRVALIDDSNHAYSKFKEALFKPFQHKIETKTITADEVSAVLKKAFASKGVLAWEVKSEDGQWKSGIDLPGEGRSAFSASNVLKVFEAVDRVFKDLFKQASDFTNFRKAEIEEERKN